MKRKAFVNVAIVALVILAVSAESAHAGTFGAMFEKLKESVQSFGDFLKLFLPVGGLACLGFGLFKFIQNNPQDTMFDKMVWILVGACLLGLAAFVIAATGSLGLESGGGGVTF